MFLVLRIRIIEIHCQKPVDHSVRITTYRRREMRVELESKSVMSDIVRAVASFGHRPQRQNLYSAEFRFVFRLVKKSIESLGYFLAIVSAPHLITEIAGKLTKPGDLLAVRLVMDTIDKCLGFLLLGTVHLAASRDKFRYRPVSQQHELLYKPIGLLGDLLIYSYRTAFFVHFDVHFRTLETDRTCCKSLFAQFSRKIMHRQYRLLQLTRNDTAFIYAGTHRSFIAQIGFERFIRLSSFRTALRSLRRRIQDRILDRRMNTVRTASKVHVQ
uniref:Uncharacterized protein n=1 Tax=uncultured prokaryote TaxID=198431 RepID=A0A0H5Q336_9ZZZZ|nr:hypothetical protein [uncultured prokaryote]